jgi:hypothetical protein
MASVADSHRQIRIVTEIRTARVGGPRLNHHATCAKVARDVRQPVVDILIGSNEVAQQVDQRGNWMFFIGLAGIKQHIGNPYRLVLFTVVRDEAQRRLRRQRCEVPGDFLDVTRRRCHVP